MVKISEVVVGKHYRLKQCVDSFGKYYSYAKVNKIYKKGNTNSPDPSKTLIEIYHKNLIDEEDKYLKCVSANDLVEID